MLVVVFIAKCVTITTVDPNTIFPQHLLCTNDKVLSSTTQKEPVYADLQHSTNSPISTLSVGQVQYATVQSQTDKTKSKVTGEPVYTDLHHSTNPPAPPLPAELVPVQYATVKKQTNNTVTAQPESKEQRSHYADLTHSTNRPAPPLPAELNPVHYKTATTTSPQVSLMMFVGLLNR